MLSTRQRALLSAALFVFVLSTLLVVEYLHRNYAELTLLHRNERLSQQLSLVRANIESEINANIFIADSLATLIAVNPASSANEWQKLAEAIFLKTTNLRNIALAPDNVIRFVYPLTGNEAVLGFDYRNAPEQLNTIEKAQAIQDIVIAGPLPLIQGGNAVIARIPIFTDPPFNQHYWGVCSAVIDIDKLFQLAGLYELANLANVAIRGKDSSGKDGAVFFGDPEVFNQAFTTETVRLLNGSWVIALAEQSGSSLNDATVAPIAVRAVGYAISSLLLVVFISLFYSYQYARLNSLQDPLTLLPNRRFAMKWLEKLINAKAAFCIISIDLDKFKQINDNFGHAEGDRYLQEVSQVLVSNLRASDTACRLSGDEFLLILPRISKQQDIENLLTKLSAQFEAARFKVAGKQLPFAMSIGYACFPSQAQDLETLLHIADVAMYQQKAQHKAAEN